jgi:hypothetical protein
MPRRAMVGASLDELLAMALPLLQEAQRQCPRTGPGRKPTYEDWTIATMILCAALKKKKSKSAMYRFVAQHQNLFMTDLHLERLPARSTFCDRYPRVWPLVQAAIRLQGRRAIQEHVCDARAVAVDKSLVPARGPVWHSPSRKRGVVPAGLHGVDTEAAWGHSDYHSWVWGYSFEVVVTAPPANSGAAAFPLIASADVGSASEHRTCPQKLEHLPPSTEFVLADSGYDDERMANQVERRSSGADGNSRRGRRGRRRGGKRRRFLCPPRDGKVGQYQQKGERERQRQRRLERYRFLCSARGQTLYARRKQTVEPFNARLKQMFELEDHAWHRGLNNNRTQILTAIFGYQLLVRYHWKHNKGRDAQVQYLLDGL